MDTVVLYFVFVFVILSCLFLEALWSPAGEGLTSWRSCMRCFLVICYFPFIVLCKVWYLILSIAELCLIPYLNQDLCKIRKFCHIIDSLYPKN